MEEESSYGAKLRDLGVLGYIDYDVKPGDHVTIPFYEFPSWHGVVVEVRSPIDSDGRHRPHARVTFESENQDVGIKPRSRSWLYVYKSTSQLIVESTQERQDSGGIR